MGAIAGVRHLARQPTWRWWTLGSFLARLPITMTLIALVLLGEQVTGSLAVGAQLSGLALLASGASALWRGRMLDRSELTAGLRRDCLLTTLALAGLAAAAATAAPTAALFGLAGVYGVSMSPLSGGFRALLPAIVVEGDLPRANTLEAVFVEVAFVTGPALAGILALLLGPVGVLVVMAASTAVSAVIVSTLPTLHPPAERSPSPPWRMAGVRPVLLIALTMGVAVGMFESLIPPRVVALGSDAEMAGPLLALVAVGSAVGGLIATSRADAIIDVRRPAAWLLVAMGLVLAPSAVVPSLLLLGGALLLAGAPIAPLNALGTLRLQRVVARGRQAEGFSIYIAAVTLGAGAGQSLVGLLLEVMGPEWLLLVSAALPLLAGLVVTAWVATHRSTPLAHTPPVDPAAGG